MAWATDVPGRYDNEPRGGTHTQLPCSAAICGRKTEPMPWTKVTQKTVYTGQIRIDVTGTGLKAIFDWLQIIMDMYPF